MTYSRALVLGSGGTVAVVLALVMAVCARAVPAPVAPSSALWSRSLVGSINPAVIDRGIVVFGRTADFGPQNRMSTTALDVSSGKLLWERTGQLPLYGTPLFLAAGSAVERIDERTGRTIWRSAPLCNGTGVPSYAVSIGKRLYVGCTGGELAALDLTAGRLLASASPMKLDEYDQIVPLGNGRLGIGGKASGAFMHRQSAIVRSDTLSSVVVFGPDHRILGVRDGVVLVDDACCGGTKSDSWPGVVKRVSLVSGATISTVSLHPYQHALSPDSDLPGPGTILTVGNNVYVGTHSALFVYDLANLNARPRMLYDNLANYLPVIANDRYLFLELGPSDSQQTVLLDGYANARAIWREAGRWGLRDQRGSVLQIIQYATGVSSLLSPSVTPRVLPVDPSCAIEASNESFAFLSCRNLEVASKQRLGSVPKCITIGQSSACPESIAVYALPAMTRK
jgi:outer membrane protein assembly factor BamB